MVETIHIICMLIAFMCGLGIIFVRLRRAKEIYSTLRERVVNPSPQHQEALIDTLTGHQDAIESLAFKPDGSTLASADYVGDIILWDVSKLNKQL